MESATIAVTPKLLNLDRIKTLAAELSAKAPPEKRVALAVVATSAGVEVRSAVKVQNRWAIGAVFAWKPGAQLEAGVGAELYW